MSVPHCVRVRVSVNRRNVSLQGLYQWNQSTGCTRANKQTNKSAENDSKAKLTVLTAKTMQLVELIKTRENIHTSQQRGGI